MRDTKTRTGTRQGKYKVGTCKFTVTIPNEDKVRIHRRAVRLGFEDDSAYMRAVIHEAVWKEPLLPEDLDTLKKMFEQQENA